MRIKNILFFLSFFILSSCAQVPKESVELSATVGRDIAVAHKAHLQLATLLFSKMKQDVNRFVDNVYAPHQIRIAMNRQRKLAKSEEPRVRKKSLMLAIGAAFKPSASDKLQNSVIKGMGILITKIRVDVEGMREELLTPVNGQEKMVLESINRAYQQMHYANSIVTGHLSSVVKIHDVQDEIMSEIGVERDLRKVVGEGIADVSTKITDLVNFAEKNSHNINKAEEGAKKLKGIIGKLDIILKKGKGDK